MSTVPQAVQEQVHLYGTRTFWYSDTGIAGFAPTGILAPTAVEESKQLLRDLIAQMTDPRHAYIVFHFQNLNSLSPRLRQTALDIVSSLQPDQTLHAAILLKNNLMVNLMSVFTTILHRQFEDRFDYHLFKDEAAAFAWLQNEQAKHSVQAG